MFGRVDGESTLPYGGVSKGVIDEWLNIWLNSGPNYSVFCQVPRNDLLCPELDQSL